MGFLNCEIGDILAQVRVTNHDNLKRNEYEKYKRGLGRGRYLSMVTVFVNIFFSAGHKRKAQEASKYQC